MGGSFSVSGAALTNSEFETVQRFCQLVSEKFAALELDITIEHDFGEFVEFRRAASARHIINPTFHPDFSTLTRENSFWLRATDTWGNTVATCAKRVMVTDCFHDDLVTLRLWQDKPVEVPPVLFRGINCDVAHRLSGRVAHSGGFWVNPEWRKKNLSGLLSDLGRGLLLRNIGFDHITGVMLDDLAATGIGISHYGYPETGGTIDVNFYGSEVDSRLVFIHMSRWQTIDQMRAWLLFPELNSLQALLKVRQGRIDGADQQLIDTPSISAER
jgi:hypothetical protein